VDVIQRYF
jgi:3'-phosphoadenosine 5'-phosphosulfate sulfotransferase